MKIKPSQVKTIKLVCCGQGFNRKYQGHYNRYKVLIDSVPIERIFTREELNKLAHWVNRSKVMAMSVWGGRQEFEAKVSLGYFFGWYYDKNKKPKMYWTEFCKLIEQIEAIY